MTKQRRVVCAAHRHKDTGEVIVGVRHFDQFILRQIELHGDGEESWINPNFNWIEQGFVDQYGEFLTREEAMVIAKEQGQIYRHTCDGDELYSENLY